ncbi:hypothetical protein SUGI_0295340 [Cryptomeria japonica]|nr:hypothetical protein SUGI_0295340 [Cryptomeria japonica]
MGMLDRLLRFNSSSILASSVKSSLVSALLYLLLILQTTVKAEEQDELYAKYCQEFVPASKPVKNNFLPLYSQLQALGFGQARYDGGESLLNITAYIWNPKSKYVSFSVSSALRTDQEGVFKISGQLNFRSRSFPISIADRGFRKPFGRTRLPKIRPRVGVFTVSADGFWSNLTHRVCLIGTGYRYLSNDSTNVFHVSVKFSYPGTSTIFNTLITGTVESIEKGNHFDNILTAGVYEGAYEYTKLEDFKRLCSDRVPVVFDANIDVLKGGLYVAKSGDICEWHWLKGPLELKWDGSCNGRDCSPLNEEISSKETFDDLGSDVSIQGSDKQRGYGSLYPFTVGNNLIGMVHTNTVDGGQLNVSYTSQFRQPIRYTPNGASAKSSAQEMNSISA